MASTRRLAAVMFTDMVGYTSLAQTDERAALQLVKDQEELLRPLFALHRGREVKSTGDGLLVEFESAREATLCAIEIQQRLHERNSQPGVTRLIVRIGIHLGDVEQRGTDIFGDAVNIASRIEPVAEPGGISLSGQLFDQVKNKVPYRIERVQPRTLKGIQDPVELYRVVLPWEDRGRPEGASSHPRLAVLPLANISPDPKDEYFADGLTEELISVLSQIQGLRVISRTSASHYRATTKAVGQIGAELSVGFVLEGSVRKAGDQLRITMQLVDVETDEHRWAKTFDRKLDNVFAIQAEVALETAQALKLELVGSEREAIHRKPTENLSAYDLFLHGVAASRVVTPEGNAEAVRCLEGAVRIDPKFGLARAYLANALLIGAGDFRPGREVFPRAREMVGQSLALDPRLSEAYTASGNLAMQADQDWARAERDFRTAIELNPSSSTAMGWYGVMLVTLRRLDEAKERFRAAIELDPFWDALPRWLIRVHYELGELEAAAELARQAAAKFPAAQWTHPFLGLIYLRAGQREKAEAEARCITGTVGVMGSDAAYLLHLVGRSQEARSILAEWQQRARTDYVSALRIARLLAALGEREAAMEMIEQEVRLGDSTFWFVYRMEEFDSLRDDPRFVALLRRFNLPLAKPQR